MGFLNPVYRILGLEYVEQTSIQNEQYVFIERSSYYDVSLDIANYDCNDFEIVYENRIVYVFVLNHTEILDIISINLPEDCNSNIIASFLKNDKLDICVDKCDTKRRVIEMVA